MTDWELWSCALQVMAQHDDRAHVHVAERIGALALADDMEGVATWKAIAGRIDQLFDYGKARPKSRH